MLAFLITIIFVLLKNAPILEIYDFQPKIIMYIEVNSLFYLFLILLIILTNELTDFLTQFNIS